MFRSGMKYGVLFLVLASAAIFSACGEESAATQTSSMVGPTLPTGYYFDMTISPSVIEAKGSTTVTVRVLDSAGAAAATVDVYVSGSSDKGAVITTGANGIGAAFLDITGTGTGTSYLTATLENKSVTVSYIVVSAN